MQISAMTAKMLRQSLAFAVALGLLLFIPAGRLDWPGAWLFLIESSLLGLVIGLALAWRDPALLAERMRKPGSGGESRSDMAILFAVKVCFLSALVLSALDVRFSCTPRLPLWSEVCGGILLLGGSFFMLRAFADNTYASQLVRIQSERGQHVVDTGVYGLVRHPMYLGGSLMFLGGPLLLGSVCGLLASLAAVGFLILRILGEEKLLTRDLEGYQAYCEKVRCRLLPHVW